MSLIEKLQAIALERQAWTREYNAVKMAYDEAIRQERSACRECSTAQRGRQDTLRNPINDFHSEEFYINEIMVLQNELSRFDRLELQIIDEYKRRVRTPCSFDNEPQTKIRRLY